MMEPKRVLLIEPDKDARGRAAAILRENGFGPDDGFVLVELGDFEVGWQAIQRDQDFLVVVCEYKSPGQTGYMGDFPGFQLHQKIRFGVGRIPGILFYTEDPDCGNHFDPDPTLMTVCKSDPARLPDALHRLIETVETRPWA